MNDMLKKYAKMDQTPKSRRYFEEKKEVIVNALVLVSPNHKNPFYKYSFSLGHACTTILTQRTEENEENLISFMRTPFKDA